MTTDNDRCLGQMLTDEATHLANLDQVRLDRADADYIVGIILDLLDESLFAREVEQRAWGVEIDLYQHQPP